MTREEARKMAEIMLAYADGKNIQFTLRKIEEWQSCEEPIFNFSNYDYRVELKYRPFKNAYECWEEMKKHEPFGWMQNKNSLSIMCISMVGTIHVCLGPNYQCTYQCAFDSYTFVDGEPFGIKEE